MISPSSPVNLGSGKLPIELSTLVHGWIYVLSASPLHAKGCAASRLTAANRSISVGKHKPVAAPMGVRVAIHPYSSRSSAPSRLDERRPRTKKPVL